MKEHHIKTIDKILDNTLKSIIEIVSIKRVTISDELHIAECLDEYTHKYNVMLHHKIEFIHSSHSDFIKFIEAVHIPELGTDYILSEFSKFLEKD